MAKVSLIQKQRGVDKNQPGNVDLMKLQKAAWGNFGYEP